MEISKLFGSVYSGKRVLVTGHSGFKGSWLTFWLNELGAEVLGFSLSPNTNPSHWNLLDITIKSVFDDIRDENKLKQTIKDFKPEIVFHLAAQPLVRYSYNNPIETYETNVLGTLKLFEACKLSDHVKAIVNVTTDKCYENKEWIWGYRENDSLGGYDPYSSSKACSEILTSSYRNSFFNLEEYGKSHQILLASARAGNVIGGGDWAANRLIPDIMRATDKNQVTEIRNPFATRPWQHVLEPLSGYLLLGWRLLEGHKEFADSWNFGPEDTANLSVGQVCNFLSTYWDKIDFRFNKINSGPHEAKLLKLDCSKANSLLQWKPVWDNDSCFKKTTNWYKDYYEGNIVNTKSDLDKYIKDANEKKLIWIK